MRAFPTAIMIVAAACLFGLPNAALADDAAERAEIDSKVDGALANLRATVPDSQAIEKPLPPLSPKASTSATKRTFPLSPARTRTSRS